MLSHSVVSKCLQTHGLDPTRLLYPWGFSRQKYWSGLPCPPPWDLSNPGTDPRPLTLQADSLLSEPPGNPYIYIAGPQWIILELLIYMKWSLFCDCPSISMLCPSLIPGSWLRLPLCSGFPLVWINPKSTNKIGEQEGISDISPSILSYRIVLLSDYNPLPTAWPSTG